MDVTGRLTIHCDSSAERGFCQLVGAGSCGFNRNQGQRSEDQPYGYCITHMNVADIGTKYQGGQCMVELLRLQLHWQLKDGRDGSHGTEDEHILSWRVEVCVWHRDVTAMATMIVVGKICRIGRSECKRKGPGGASELGVLRELVEYKGNQPVSGAAKKLMTTWPSRDIATGRQVKYLRDLARKRSARVNTKMLVGKQSASEQIQGWTGRYRV
eukprot:6486679-Amphidinium_carterae.1